MDDLVVGDRARVRGRLGRRDAFPTPLFTLLAEPLLADEREDAVGLLGEVDRGET